MAQSVVLEEYLVKQDRRRFDPQLSAGPLNSSRVSRVQAHRASRATAKWQEENDAHGVTTALAIIP
jgi:hypothetical protein